MLSLSLRSFLTSLLFLIPVIYHFRNAALLHPHYDLTSQSQLRCHELATSSPDALRNTTSPQPALHSDATILHQTPIDEISYEHSSPRIRQVTMLFGGPPNEIDEQSLNTHTEHGKRWGCPTHILRQNLIGSDDWQEFSFSKPSYMLSILIFELAKPEDERAEWLVWFDADTIIMNPNVPWATFLPPVDSFPDIHIVGAKDWNSFNPGVFLIRVNGWSLKLLTQVYALKQIRPDITFGQNADQDAMIWVMDRPGYREHVIYQPIEWFQGYQDPRGQFRDVQPGDLLIHFPGWRDKRFKYMDEYLEKLRTNKSEWHIQLYDTSYPTNVDAYWSRLRDARGALQKADVLLQPSSRFTEEVGDGGKSNDHISKLNETVSELRRTIEEEAYKPKKLLEAVEQVLSAVHAADEYQVGEPDDIKAAEETAGN